MTQMAVNAATNDVPRRMRSALKGWMVETWRKKMGPNVLARATPSFVVLILVENYLSRVKREREG